MHTLFASLRRAAVLTAATLTLPLLASAQTIWGLVGTGLVSFDAATPATVQPLALSGLSPTQTLVGLDFRPATGELFALAYNAAATRVQLYRVNRTTGQLIASGLPIVLDLGPTATRIGFDFDPVEDVVRVVSSTDVNVRLSPTTGTVLSTDTPVAFGAGDAHAGQNPAVGSLAHTNSYAGATTTVLYALDEAQGLLLTQQPAAGTLQTVAPVGVAMSGGADLDIYTDFNALKERTYLVASEAGTSTLYALNPTTGAPTALGAIGANVTDMAVEISRPGLVTGQLLYALAGSKLISFDSDLPGTIRDFVAVTGIASGQTIVGADFRPATGDLYVLGYNTTTQQGQLYKLDRATGVAAPVGTMHTLSLGSGPDHVGFDFDPLTDRARVTTTARRSYRLNPTDGSVTAQALLTYAPGDPAFGQAPAVGAAAYAGTGSAASVFYGYDEVRNTLVTQSQAGALLTVGGAGLTVNRTTNNVDFDLVHDALNNVDLAFMAAGAGTATADNLYSVDLSTGTGTVVGPIGSGLSVSALAAFRRAEYLVWTGLVSTDWHLAANWLPLQVPTTANSVLIPRTTRQPTIAASAEVNYLVLDTATVVTMLDGSVLTLSGSLANYFGSLAGTGTAEVRLVGTLPQGIAGTGTTFQNLTIGPAGAALAGPASVRRLLTLDGTLVATGFPFTLLSDGSGTAEVINHGEAAVVGPVTVQRYINPSSYAGTAYRHYASPVQHSVVADLTTPGFTPVVNAAYNTAPNPRAVTPYPNVFGFDEARITTSAGSAAQNFTAGYFSPASLADQLLPGRGYTVRIAASQKVDFVGQLNNDSLLLANLTRGTQTESGWHLLGNPYPSPIDWTQLFPQTTGLNNAISVWRPTGTTAGVYGTYVNGVAANGGSPIIGAMQGFFVRTTTPGVAGSIQFTNAARLTTYASPSFYRPSTEQRPLVRLALAEAGSVADEVVVYAEAGATSGFDPGFDAAKPVIDSMPQLMIGGTELQAIAGIAPLTGMVSLPLLLTVPQAGTYTLNAAELLNLPVGCAVELLDGQTGTVVDLRQQPSYAFQLSQGGFSTRFTLRLTPGGVLSAPLSLTDAELALWPNPAHDAITLALPAELTRIACPVRLLDGLGRLVREFTVPAGTAHAQTLSLAGVAPGVYAVQVRTLAGALTRRLVIE